RQRPGDHEDEPAHEHQPDAGAEPRRQEREREEVAFPGPQHVVVAEPQEAGEPEEHQRDGPGDAQPAPDLVADGRRLGGRDPLERRPEDEGVEEHGADEHDGRVDVDDQRPLVDGTHPGYSAAASSCSSPAPMSTPRTAGKFGQAQTKRAGSSWGLWWQSSTPASRTGTAMASPASHSKRSPSTSVTPRPVRMTIISPPCQR